MNKTTWLGWAAAAAMVLAPAAQAGRDSYSLSYSVGGPYGGYSVGYDNYGHGRGDYRYDGYRRGRSNYYYNYQPYGYYDYRPYGYSYYDRPYRYNGYRYDYRPHGRRHHRHHNHRRWW